MNSLQMRELESIGKFVFQRHKRFFLLLLSSLKEEWLIRHQHFWLISTLFNIAFFDNLPIFLITKFFFPSFYSGFIINLYILTEVILKHCTKWTFQLFLIILSGLISQFLCCMLLDLYILIQFLKERMCMSVIVSWHTIILWMSNWDMRIGKAILRRSVLVHFIY